MTESNSFNIFSGLENLGFKDVEKVNLYSDSDKKEEQAIKEAPKNDPLNFLYKKEIQCPVCSTTFKAISTKVNGPRKVKTQSDFFIEYAVVNPYFYDVWLCPTCGYATLKVDFNKISDLQRDKINKTIRPKWKNHKYPDVYDEDIAIERYKIALLNYLAMDGKSSSKAFTCLKIAWMYRLKGDSNQELGFLTQALRGFDDAYFHEKFPIYGMDKYTMLYLLGELNRRLGNDVEALRYFGEVVTTPGVSPKIKELARDQKDVIKGV